MQKLLEGSIATWLLGLSLREKRWKERGVGQRRGIYGHQRAAP